MHPPRAGFAGREPACCTALKPLAPSTPSEPQAEAALAALRRATRERHAAVDQLLDLQRLTQRACYGRVLQVFEAFLAPWEQAVAAALPAEADWLQQRSRLPMLRRDVAALGLPALARMPAPVLLPSRPAAWGSLYVVEGSALGGQVIARALGAAGIGPDSGAAYFHGWGPATGSMWRGFRLRLARELHGPEATADACAAACHTFDALAGLLRPALNERAALA